MRSVLISSGRQKKYCFIFSNFSNNLKSYQRNTVPERLANIMNLGSGRLSITVDLEGDLMVGYYPKQWLASLPKTMTAKKLKSLVKMVNKERFDEDARLDFQDRNDTEGKELCHAD